VPDVFGFRDVFTEAHEDRSHLCALGVALRHKLPVAAVYESRSAGPLHRGHRVFGYAPRVRIAEKLSVFAYADIVFLALRIAVEDGDHLLAADVVVSAEGRFDIADDKLFSL